MLNIGALLVFLPADTPSLAYGSVRCSVGVAVEVKERQKVSGIFGILSSWCRVLTICEFLHL